MAVHTDLHPRGLCHLQTPSHVHSFLPDSASRRPTQSATSGKPFQIALGHRTKNSPSPMHYPLPWDPARQPSSAHARSAALSQDACCPECMKPQHWGSPYLPTLRHPRESSQREKAGGQMDDGASRRARKGPRMLPRPGN